MMASLAMVGAALLQAFIYKQSPCGNQASTCYDADDNPLVANINVWLQTPVYFLIALSEVLASITSLECVSLGNLLLSCTFLTHGFAGMPTPRHPRACVE